MRVTVAFIDPASGKALCREIECAAGTTAQQAALLAKAPVASQTQFAVWNEFADADRQLSDSDRVDVLCPTLIDPKVARRLRAEHAGQEAKSSVARHGGRHQLRL